MEERILHHYLDEFRSGFDLDSAEAEMLFEALIACDDEALLTNLLAAWCDKGFTDDELFAFASIMRRRMVTVNSNRTRLVDIVGTGGSTAKTFNVSTAAAFVVAGAGVPVAKHGNRAATSKCGSSDVLAHLGIDIDIDAHAAEKCLAEIGICFLFAPRFHSFSPSLAQARRSLNKPTIFNSLGPLCNPASASHQVIGVRDSELMALTASVLERLGTVRSWIVTGKGGLDEISLSGPTQVAEVSADGIKRFEVSAADFGTTAPAECLPSNCNPAESAEIIKDVIGNKAADSAPERLVLINAAAAIYVAGRGETLPTAYQKAQNSIRSGAAYKKLLTLAAR